MNEHELPGMEVAQTEAPVKTAGTVEPEAQAQPTWKRRSRWNPPAVTTQAPVVVVEKVPNPRPHFGTVQLEGPLVPSLLVALQLEHDTLDQFFQRAYARLSDSPLALSVAPIPEPVTFGVKLSDAEIHAARDLAEKRSRAGRVYTAGHALNAAINEAAEILIDLVRNRDRATFDLVATYHADLRYRANNKEYETPITTEAGRLRDIYPADDYRRYNSFFRGVECELRLAVPLTAEEKNAAQAAERERRQRDEQALAQARQAQQAAQVERREKLRRALGAS